MTKGDVGYLVMDVDATASQEALDTLKTLKAQSHSRIVLIKYLKPQLPSCGFYF